jgi:hypothetical protein
MRIQKYIFLAAVFGLTVAAQADSLYLYDIPNGAPQDINGNYISPYAGVLMITSPSNILNISFSCDDFTHNINTGQIYSGVTESQLGASNFLSTTLLGKQVGVVPGFTVSAATNLYEQVFYLSSLEASAIALHTTAGNNDAGVIQDAMWDLTNPYEPNNATHSDPPNVANSSAPGNKGSNYYMTLAAANYQNYTYSNFTIVDAGAGSIQELFYSTGTLNTAVGTPEPGTIALLMGGLGALGFYRRRRSSQS